MKASAGRLGRAATTSLAAETYKRNLVVFSLLARTACGVSANTELSSLDQEQAQSLCEETEEPTITCGEATFSSEITLGGDCDAEYTAPPEGCTATVGDYRACQDAFAALNDEEICEAVTIPCECDPRRVLHRQRVIRRPSIHDARPESRRALAVRRDTKFSLTPAQLGA